MKKLSLVFFLNLVLFSPFFSFSQIINVHTFDSDNASRAFELAMKSNNDTIYFDLKNSPYILKPMRFKEIKNKTIILEKGVELKALEGAFPKTNDALIKFMNCERVSILGNGATLSMNKSEYIDGEWRHIIRIMGSKFISLKDLTLRDSGGDGVTIGQYKDIAYSENISIDRVKCLNNKRQGISIVSAKNVTVTNSLFAETKGTLPGAGLDIEPDVPEHVIENIEFRACVFENNYNSGIKIALVRLDSTSTPVSIRFDNCLLRNNFCLEEFKVPSEIMIKSHKINPVKGYVIFENCHVEDSNWGFLFAKINAKGFDVEFKRCSAKNICKSAKMPAIYLETPHFKERTELGGINFNTLYLDYASNVSVMRVLGSRRGAMKHLSDVEGDFIISSEKTLPIDYDAYNPNNNHNVKMNIIYKKN